MELVRYLDVIRKWIWLIVLATVLATGSGLIASLLAVPVYRTSTTLIVGQVIEDPNPNAGDFYAGEQLARTYVQLVTREPVLAATVQTLGLPQDWLALRGQVNAAQVAGTQLIEISVLDTNPERAKAIANELARQLILQSPTTPSSEDQARREFVRSQLPELEERIKDAQASIADLDQVIASASSARQIQEAQQRQAVLQSQISQWQGTHAALLSSLQQGNLNYVSVVDPAETPRTPVSPNIPLNTILAAVIGLSLSVGAAFLLEYLDDTVRTADEVRNLVGAPVLATIGSMPTGKYHDMLIVEREPRSPLTESYRSLRTNLQFQSIDRPLRVLLVTSSTPGEGKSVTSANLAAVFSHAGKSVILVDADLRRPVAHDIFDLDNSAGLTNWLVEQDQETAAVSAIGNGRAAEMAASDPKRTLDGYLQNTALPRLRVMQSGSRPPNPAEILGSNRMREFLQIAQATADIVIIDSPPCVTVTDAVVLSHWVDGVILVVDAQSTMRQTVRRARENLEAAGARILGTVVNRVDMHGGGYYYGYAGRYHQYYSSGERSNGKARANKRAAGSRPDAAKKGPLALWNRLVDRKK